MAIINETAEWVDDIYQLETSDPVKGGTPVLDGGTPTDGWSNVQALQLANRTAYLQAASLSRGFESVDADTVLTDADLGKVILVQNSSLTPVETVEITLPSTDDVEDGQQIGFTYINELHNSYQTEVGLGVVAMMCTINAGAGSDRIWNGQFRSTKIHMSHGETIVLRKQLNNWWPVVMEGAFRHVGEIVQSISMPAKGGLPCDGSVITPELFPRLCEFIDGAADALGTDFVLDDDTDFATKPGLFVKDTSFTPTRYRIPDLRGYFLRGLQGVDSDVARQLGSSQLDEFKSHTHTWNKSNTATFGTITSLTVAGTINDAGKNETDETGGLETRPKNIAVNFYVRF
jgi:hypothetical protein